MNKRVVRNSFRKKYCYETNLFTDLIKLTRVDKKKFINEDGGDGILFSLENGMTLPNHF